MAGETFAALILAREGGKTRSTITQLRRDDLPPGEVLVAVEYSSLNYKDGLAITGKGPIVRPQDFPMVPGIDFAGTVEESASPDYRPGDKVVLTGWGVGERHWGGLAQRARVQAGWLVPLPAGLTTRQAMGIGTAGFTAMLCIMALEERGLAPGEDQREIAVTGAGGGVGGVAVAVLSHLGHNVTAITGRAEIHDYLRDLGARRIVGRDTLPVGRARPLESERWGGAIDTVGGDMLAALLATMAHNATVACCGNAGGVELSTTVFPFILRGVALVGVESVRCAPPRRRAAWSRLARDLPPAALDRMTQTAALADVPALAEQITQGRVRGRIVVDVNR